MDQADVGSLMNAGGQVILVVEDSPTQALQLRRALEADGFSVVVAPDGRSALQLVRSRRIDGLITDVLMPGMDGFQLCLEIRNDPAIPRIPIILVSASFTSDENRAFAAQLGADAYIDKSASRDQLIAKLHDVLSGRDTLSVAKVVDEHSFRVRYGELMASRLVEEAAALKRAHEELAAAYELTLDSLVAALDLRDTETELHAWRVSGYSAQLAFRLGLDDRFITELERGSLLHDIGKIGIRDRILRKPGPLTGEEWVEMHKHPRLGFEMLSHIDFLRDAAAIVLAHHERWDGKGYPQALAAEAIPLGARIFAVSDTIDAITSDRPYRKARSFEVALDIVATEAGTQFDPEVVKAALSIGPTDWEAIRAGIEEDRRLALHAKR
ncbi:MAG: HD domain-containing phosphohydrolase [Actinomycetota bacterium]